MTCEYSLNERNLKRVTALGFTTCYRCKKAFVLGDRIISRHTTKTVHYHKKCFESLFHEESLEDEKAGR